MRDPVAFQDGECSVLWSNFGSINKLKTAEVQAARFVTENTLQVNEPLFGKEVRCGRVAISCEVVGSQPQLPLRGGVRLNLPEDRAATAAQILPANPNFVALG